MSKTIYIGGRLESKEKGNVVTGANAILDDTKGKKQNVINKETDDELLRLEQSKQDNLTFDNAPTEDSTNPVTSGGVYTAEKALSDAIEAILLLIPSAATALNKLVDTNTMNSSISTATATFRGTYNAVSDLGLTYQATHAQIEAALDALGLTADNNDFAFVQIPVSDQSQDIAKTERFKFNGTNWLYEYDLNTSGFTAAQWAAINSGITVALVTKLTDLPTAAALQLALNAKQDTLTFDNEPTALSQNPVYSGGIYTAIQAVVTALGGRLDTLEGLIPSEASSSNKLTDKAYVDGLIQAITELIPAEADTTNQLADKAYVLAQILAATPAFKGQFVTLAELQAVASPKAGDLGIVRTKDSDGMDVFTVYQYLSNAWNVFCSLSYHPQTKPATTGTTGDYPYNGTGRVEMAKNMVNTGTELAPVMVNQLTQDMFYKGAVGSRVPNTNTIFVIQYDYELSENITIPDGCVLEFDGGSISGAYTITGANTGIKAGLVKIFDTTTTLAGTWNVAEAYSEWFGAIGDGETDSTTAIQKTIDTLNATNISTIYLANKYLVSAPIIINSRRIVVKGSINRYEDFNLIVGDTFTPATIDGKVVKAVLALTKPIDIYNIGINGNKKANCIQWYAGWSAGVIENCQLAGGIGAGIAGFVTETLYIRNNFIHDCPIGVRISRFYFTVANDTDYSIFGIQNTNPNMGDFYCIEISGNVIECTGINIFLSHGCAVNIVNNLTAHSQIWGYYLYELRGVRIEGNYSEGEGVCAADGFTNVSGVDVLGAASQALIDNNLNGVALSATECLRAQAYMFDCHEVTISNTYLSYKKHSNKLVASEFDFDKTKAGIDSHVIWDFSTVLNIDSTRMANWNADHISPYTGDVCAIFDVAFKRHFPVLNIRHITDIPVFAMERAYYGPSVKLRIEHENMGNIVDMTASKWSTSLSWTPTDYTQSFAEMPVTLVKTLGAHKYYKFNSNAGATHFSIDIPNLKRRSSKDYIQVMLPYINNSADDRFVIDTTTFNAGSNIGTMYFRDDYGKGMGVLIATLPIDMVCDHTDLCIRMLNGNGYDDMSFCVPTINYVGCEEIM